MTTKIYNRTLAEYFILNVLQVTSCVMWQTSNCCFALWKKSATFTNVRIFWLKRTQHLYETVWVVLRSSERRSYIYSGLVDIIKDWAWHAAEEAEPLTFSLSSNIQKKGVMAPMSRACVVMAMMWFRMRVNSPYRTADTTQNPYNRLKLKGYVTADVLSCWHAHKN